MCALPAPLGLCVTLEIRRQPGVLPLQLFTFKIFLKQSHSEEKVRLKLRKSERIHCFPSPNFSIMRICYLKITYFSHCLSKEAWANATVSAVNDFVAFFFLFYVLATVEMTPLIDRWATCDVFVLA